MRTKGDKLMEQMFVLYENIHNMLTGFHKAIQDKSNEIIEIDFINPDGTKIKIPINSLYQLQKDIERIDNNFKSLTTDTSYVYGKDGNVEMIRKSTLANTEYIDWFKKKENCIVSDNNILDDLIYPIVKLPIEISNDITSKNIICKIYSITRGYNKLIEHGENLREINIKYLKDSDLIDYDYFTKNLVVDTATTNFFGKFTVINVEDFGIGLNKIITINKLKYTTKNSLGDTIHLKVGDNLLSDSKLTKYKILSIDPIYNKIELEVVSGLGLQDNFNEEIKSGDELFFEEKIKTKTNIVSIPVKPKQKLVIFLSTIKNNIESYPSQPIFIDTENYVVNHDGLTYTLDEYFHKFVINFTEYLQSIINENNIPLRLSIKPNKPKLDRNNFRVVQINKHILSATTTDELLNFNKEKVNIQNQINYKNNLIKKIQDEIETIKYDSIDEKQHNQKRLIELKQEVNILEQNKLTIINNINLYTTKYGLKNNKPKYKLIGFWDIQKPILSPVTKPQHIIKYEIQYRYLSKNIDTIESTSYKMVSDGKEQTVVFSNWIDLRTRTLNKVLDKSGKLIWEKLNQSSVDDININQLSISIKENESIEFRIRAVSEAGYPLSPIKSDWSDIIRVDFPDDINDTTIQSIVTQNLLDLNKAELNKILDDSGILKHMASTIVESEKIFHHQSSDIASGLFTPEQKSIPLDVVLKTIMGKLSQLENSDYHNSIDVLFIDDNGEQYKISNNTTLNVFGGYYCDSNESILDSKNWGKIKISRGYLKIKNNSITPIEIRSLLPSGSVSIEQTNIYNDIPIIFGDDNNQKHKQILYFRNVDLTGYKDSVGTFNLLNSKPSTEIKTKLENTLISIDTFNCVGFDIPDTPLKYNIDLSQTNLDDTILFDKDIVTKTLTTDYLNRIKNIFNKNLRTDIKQQIQGKYNPGFEEIDSHLIGPNSVGAFLYPKINDISKVIVVGDNITSTLVIDRDSEVLIPIIFEYRLLDAAGKFYFTEDNKQEKLSKKIGIDMLINNRLFKFDLNMTCQLRNNINTIEEKTIKLFSSKYKEEPKKPLI